MRQLRMQPTFRMVVAGDADDVLAKLREAIESPDLTGDAVSAGKCVDYSIDKEEQRFWSPHLSIQACATDSGTELFGRFSPRPEVWTMFMAIYFVAATCAFGATIYGYVQWVLGWKPWGLVGMPIGLAIIVGLHLASLVGQRLSADQMELLRNRFNRAVEAANLRQLSPIPLPSAKSPRKRQ